MKVLFCKISCMKFYKGACDNDKPFNGGSFVKENGYGHEENNFYAVDISDDESYCLGFVETKSTKNGKINELHIEKIDGCSDCKKSESVNGVLVIWCATTDLNETSVVGWYKNATVYRNYCDAELDGYIQSFNMIAKKEDCVLIPHTDRHVYKWKVPVAKVNGYGFGQSLVWYPTDKKGAEYAEKMAKQIFTYNGENWIDVFPEQD